MSHEVIQVAAGIIINDAGEVLLAKRPANVHQGGLWEFPGGKLEDGENVQSALARELREELGLIVKQAHPFIKLHHEYPDRSVILHAWLVSNWHGQPYSRERQEVVWVNIGKLTEYSFPPADEMIIKALLLPPLYLISPDPGDDRYDDYCGGIEDCIKAGARLLQLRCKEETYRKNPGLIPQVLTICNQHNALLMLNSSPATAVHFNTHGVHLSSARLLQLSHRPLDKHFWISASCHNRSELIQACRIGVDFVVLSPVRITACHPDAQPLGWGKFNELVEVSNIPVYALGGMQPQHLPQAWNCGAQGVAMLSAVWSAARPAEVVRQCVQIPRYV
ncbi:MAG: Nudix family hydrolase [Gammaproteobacteria bacterium]